MDPLIGEIRMFGGNFAPVGWATCDGQLMSISQNAALFSILGTTYGGNGTTTFALPDLRGRVPVHVGTGPGLSTYVLGETTGLEHVSLTAGNLPPHTHPFSMPSVSSAQNVTSTDPAGNYPGNTAPNNSYGKPSDGTMSAGNTGANASSGQPVSVIQPLLTFTFIIALVGVYPSHG